MATQLIETIRALIDQKIVENGENLITGPVLNNVLKTMTNNIGQSFFKYPKDPSLTVNDIGKVMMNDGSGTAKRYQFAPPSDERVSKWSIEATGIANEYDTGPYGLSEYFLFTFSITGTNTGDSFTIKDDDEALFTVTIAATQDNAEYEAAYDADEATYRSNIIDVINAYVTNSGNDYLVAYESEDSDKIDIVAYSPLGYLFNLDGHDNFESESGGFVHGTYNATGTILTFITEAEEISITTDDWRTGVPSTPLQELEMIRDYINSNIDNFSASVDANDLLHLEEDVFEWTELEGDDWDTVNVTIEQWGRPALPAAPAAFPLGKLTGIDGDNALISNSFIETYPLEAPITLSQQFFDADTNMAITNESFQELINLVIIPSENGNARTLTEDDLVLTEEEDLTLRHLRHNFLGLAITASSTHVTVINLSVATLLFNFIRRAGFSLE